MHFPYFCKVDISVTIALTYFMFQHSVLEICMAGMQIIDICSSFHFIKCRNLVFRKKEVSRFLA